jgi:hypothetical protein
VCAQTHHTKLKLIGQNKVQEKSPCTNYVATSKKPKLKSITPTGEIGFMRNCSTMCHCFAAVFFNSRKIKETLGCKQVLNKEMF